MLRVHTSWACQSSSVGKEARARKIYKCSLKGTRDQIASIFWIIEKAKKFQKNIYFCFIDYAKVFDYVDDNKLQKIPRDGNTRPPYLSLRKRSRSNN